MALPAGEVEVVPYGVGVCAVGSRIGDPLGIAQELIRGRERAVIRINIDPPEMAREASVCRRRHVAGFAWA